MTLHGYTHAYMYGAGIFMRNIIAHYFSYKEKVISSHVWLKIIYFFAVETVSVVITKKILNCRRFNHCATRTQMTMQG